MIFSAFLYRLTPMRKVHTSCPDVSIAPGRPAAASGAPDCLDQATFAYAERCGV
jgi:hypothetical protein